jgi:hypothetical protein
MRVKDFTVRAFGLGLMVYSDQNQFWRISFARTDNSVASFRSLKP